FDVTFPALACSILSLDAMDISGEQHLDVKHDIIKKRIDSHGNVIETRQDGIGSPKIEKPLQKHGGRLEHNETYCGSCYGAESSDEECCNSCEEVREAYRKKGWALSNPDVIDQHPSTWRTLPYKLAIKGEETINFSTLLNIPYYSPWHLDFP
ncbi:endoplasmic reticulum-golgi intermediate compartment protein 3-like, partial [Trifolium pratense]